MTMMMTTVQHHGHDADDVDADGDDDDDSDDDDGLFFSCQLRGASCRERVARAERTARAALSENARLHHAFHGRAHVPLS